MKKLFNIVLLAMGCITAFAQVVESNNKVYIKDFTIAPGEEKTLEIILDNPDAPVSSLQFDISFPHPTNPNYGGLELMEGSLAKVSDRISNSSHSILIGQQDVNKNKYRVGVLSTSSTMGNSAIAGNNGAILTLKVRAAINYKGGNISISEVVASDATCTVNPEPYEIDIQPNSETKAGVFVGTASVSTDMQLLRNLTPTQIGVSLDNIIEVTGFQAKITLPDGVNFCEDEDGEFITLSDRLSSNIVPSVNNVPGEPNSYILVISSLTSDKFIGDEGEIFKLNLVSNKDFEQGDVLISDITVSSAPGYSYDVNIGETMAVTLKAVSDPSGDGAWDIDDVDSIIDLYLFDEYNSVNDQNDERVVDIDDVDISIDKYLNF